MPQPRNIIGPQLRKLRSERGLSQPKLAEKCQRLGWDISRDIIARIESRVRWVGDFELVILAHGLGAEPGALLPGKTHAMKAAKSLAELTTINPK